MEHIPLILAAGVVAYALWALYVNNKTHDSRMELIAAIACHNGSHFKRYMDHYEQVSYLEHFTEGMMLRDPEILYDQELIEMKNEYLKILVGANKVV